MQFMRRGWICNGMVEGRITTKNFWHRGELIVLEHVPVGICNRCKNRYYSAEVGRMGGLKKVLTWRG
ncbi:MAG: YgiT-type zinc finger protein [bacterium]